MSAFRIVRRTPESNIGVVFFGLLAVLLVALPLLDSDASLRTPLTVILYYLALAQVWNLLAGYAGMISIGQQMFVGVGAYTVLVMAEDVGLDPFLSVLVAGLVAAVLSVPAAFVAFRLRGGYFAIGTWVIAEVFRLVALEIDSLGAGNVRSLTRESVGGYGSSLPDLVYWAALALAVGATAGVVFILRGRIGLALRSVRDNEAGAQGLGVDIRRTQFVVWVASAFWTGMIGGVILLNTTSVRADSAFSVVRWTAIVIFIVVIGGVGSPIGPIIGVLVFWFMEEQFADSEEWRFILLGLLAAVMAVVAPTGVRGLLQKIRTTHFFPVQRRLVGPGTEDGP